MKRLTILPGLLAIACCLAGCGGNENQPQPGRVAVINIVQASNGIGRGKVMQAAMNTAQQEAGTKLQAMQADFTRQLNAERAKMVTMEDMKRIEQLDAQLQARYQQEVVNARNRMTALNATLVAQLRADVKPVAQRIAEERGLSVVLEATDGTMYVADECEITDAVIAAMKGSGAGVESPAAMPAYRGTGAASQPSTQPASRP